jgi:hypothetical protein
MKSNDRPSCSDPNDIIEDAIDFAKRDPKSTWDDVNRKTPSAGKTGDKNREDEKDGRVASRNRSHMAYPANMIAGF